MITLLFSLPYWLQSPEIAKIFEILGNAPDTTRFVGGAVRDALRGMESKDIDFATVHTPDIVVEKCNKAGIKVIPTGIEFGTVTLVIEGRAFEVTTLREDIDCYGRHAKVSYTRDWEKDAARRDFTINAMSCSSNGAIYDYYGGVGDLAEGKVRFVGIAEERVQEDHLRILRYFRFLALCGKASQIDSDALSACRDKALLLGHIAGERIQSEMIKLLAIPQPLFAIRQMQEIGVLEVIGLPVTGEDRLASLIVLEEEIGREPQPWLRLAALIDSLPEPEHQAITTSLAERWKLPVKQLNYIERMITKKSCRPLCTKEGLLDLLFDHGSLAADYLLLQSASQGCKKEDIRQVWLQLSLLPIPVFPVGGKDLLAIGYKPGKRIGEILARATHIWQESGYRQSKEEILEWIRHNIM